MKFTFGWLRDHLDTNASLQQIGDALTDLGLEVESINDPDEEFGVFATCRVANAWRHPNADKLRVCDLELFSPNAEEATERVQVVCGAPNARTGMIGVFAPVGARVPGTGLLLKQTAIRGVKSSGMLLSERELGISDNHDTVIDLPAGTPLGVKYMGLIGRDDPVVEIAVTPNRPDALGIRGIARDLAAKGLGTLKPDRRPAVRSGGPCPIRIVIEPDVKERGCPAFAGRLLEGVSNGESPDWLKSRIEAIGLRPISAVVDITNYVTHDRSRPLHAFDADKVRGDIRIHFARGGETVAALDGKSYELQPGMICISDDQGPESIAGIMGGEPTGCTASTTRVFLESALWDPVITAATGRKLKVVSDARHRFERGVDPAYMLEGLDLATSMILDICGGKASDIAMDGSLPDVSRCLALRTSRVEQLVGMAVDANRQVQILDGLGFSAKLNGDAINVQVPSWRPDVFGEADLVEEVARMVSLSNLPGVPLPRPSDGVTRPCVTREQRMERMARRTLGILGYRECVTYSFVDRKAARLFADNDRLVEIQNPISSELETMRPDLLPGLLQAAARAQARGSGSCALFESGPVFTGSEPGEQSLQVTGLLVGNASTRSPHVATRRVDLYDARADADAVLDSIGAPAAIKTARWSAAGWHPGKTGAAYLRPGTPLALFGEIDPRVLRQLRIKGGVAAFTVFLERVPKPRRREIARPALAASSLQPVERDFSFVVDRDIEAQQLVRAAGSSSSRKFIAAIDVFDEFSGDSAEAQFGKGRKSLAICVRLQSGHKPFSDAELARIGRDIVQRVVKATGGALRK